MNKRKKQISSTNAIDNSKMFEGTVEKDSRSIMNICFVFQKNPYKDKDDAFMEFAKGKGNGWD